jgi:hypothetical protein
LLITAAAVAPICAQGQTNIPDFSGLWQRNAVKGEVTFDPIPGDTGGKPIERVWTPGPDIEEIVSGNYDNPILQPWAREIVKANTESEIKLVHVHEADDLCWPVGLPQIINLRENVRFIQTKNQVTIIYQRDHLIRRVYLNQKHSTNPKLDWYGESVGRYEGDTLVIDTIGLNDKTVLDAYRTPHSEKLHVTERWRMTPDGKTLEVTIRIEDPEAFNQPFSVMQRYNRVASNWNEQICAENNGYFFQERIPTASAPDF